jgi:hypothetical protein
MITAAHIILYSSNAEADRVFIRDVLGLAGVDAGEGWLICQSTSHATPPPSTWKAESPRINPYGLFAPGEEYGWGGFLWRGINNCEGDTVRAASTAPLPQPARKGTTSMSLVCCDTSHSE